MIELLSKTLENILTDEVKNTEFIVLFSRPDDDFKSELKMRNMDIVSIFLYDIGENIELRSSEPVRTTVDGIVSVKPPPVRIACNYLITAWPKEEKDTDYEIKRQELLSKVLVAFLRHPTIPDKYLAGELKNQLFELPMLVLGTDKNKSLSEFWSGIGSPIVPSVTVAATIAIDVFGVREYPKVKTLYTDFSGNDGSETESMVMLAGLVLDGNQHVEGALVEILELELKAISNEKGEYIFSNIKKGVYTIQCSAQGYQINTRKILLSKGQEGLFNIALKKDH
ncbi:MAG: Pvc16 family protein [Clostridia bacterium]|nr:Pvc16 family protein [Clostridia bacterium]